MIVKVKNREYKVIWRYPANAQDLTEAERKKLFGITQCFIKLNDDIIFDGKARKHKDDEFRKSKGRMRSMAKALAKIQDLNRKGSTDQILEDKEARTEFWKEYAKTTHDFEYKSKARRGSKQEAPIIQIAQQGIPV